jgi:hypothetical protein
MSTSPAVNQTSDYDSWPSFFAHGRIFDRETENRPYVDYVDKLYSVDYSSESESGSGEEESDSDSDNDSERDLQEEKHQEWGDGSGFVDSRIIEGLSPVRRFNRAATVRVRGESKYSIRHWQEDPVADFVEHSLATRFEERGPDTLSLVAFLDIESNTHTDAIPTQRRRRTKSHCRTGLTRPEFRQQLNSPVSSKAKCALWSGI